MLAMNITMQAIPYFEQALMMNENYVSAIDNLGTAYAKLNNPDEGIRQFERALKIEPDDKTAGKNLDFVLRNKKHYEKILEENLGRLDKTPNSPELLNRLGNAYFKLGRIQTSIQFYERSIEADPNNKQAYSELGIIHLLYGKAKESTYFFKKVLRLDPDDEQAKKNLRRADWLLSDNFD